MFDSSFSSVIKRSATSDTQSFFHLPFIFGGSEKAVVTPSNYKFSLKLSAVFNAVDQISNDIAKIPFGVYKKTNGKIESQRQHQVNILLTKRPNAIMTPFVWKKTMAVSLLLRGNALSLIVSSNTGKPVELKFVNWDNVQDVYKKDGALLYKIKGYEKPFLSSEVIHWKIFSHDGVVGVGPITYGAAQMTTALEIQNYANSNFENKGIRNGVITTDKQVNSDAKGKIITGFKAAMAEKSPDRVVVLDESMKYQHINITPAEAQIVEMSRFSVEDISRWFNIAPHKIKSLQQSTNNNIEQQTIDHATDTIQPLVNNFEEELEFKLITSVEEQQGFYINGNINVLMRADLKTRMEYYAKAITLGFMNRNEAREKEEMNAGPELLNEFLTPVNSFTEQQLQQNISSQNNGN